MIHGITLKPDNTIPEEILNGWDKTQKNIDEQQRIEIEIKEREKEEQKFEKFIAEILKRGI